MRLLYEKMILAGCIFPLTSLAQDISLNKFLKLQRSSLLQIQDYVETNQWKLKGITTLQDVDSLVFHRYFRRFTDSIKNTQKNKVPDTTSVIENTQFDSPAWIEYASETDTKINSTTLFTNSFTIKLPKFYLLSAIDWGLTGYNKQDFHLSIRFGFSDINTYKALISEIDYLDIPPEATYIMYNKPLITRVYKLKDQVINLTTINEGATSYSLEIYSRSDYDYLHAVEEELRGKTDYVH